ncbi:hypothetical protein [Dokdonella sp.]|uniref:hypothetical protein n=1 Tax=Dokdonella sp. TaxID=2291710 RepID=UPI002F40A6D7
MNAPNRRRFAAILLAVCVPVFARTASAAPTDPHAPGWTAALAWVEQKIGAPEPAGIEAFGSAVAVQGDTAFVSAPKHPQDGPSGGQGIVYVYRYVDGAWTLVQSLTADDAAPGEEFGNAIALQGSIAMIAMHNAAIGGLAQAGAVYVFRYDGSQWVQAQKLVADAPLLVANFGDSIALDGDTAVIGAGNERGAAQEPSVGAAYVFTADANGTWTQAQRLASSDPHHWDQFGIAVGLAGDTIMVGVSQETWVDQNSGPGPGAVRVFTRSAGTWSESGVLRADDGVDGDYFGEMLAFDGQTLVVGAPAVGSYQGAAYVFARSGADWTQRQKLVAAEAEENAFFARSLALAGDRLALGAPGATAGETPFAGAAYLFASSGGTWAQSARLTASDAMLADYLGFAVGLVDGEHLVAGAPHDFDDGQGLSGAFYAFAADSIFVDGFEGSP